MPQLAQTHSPITSHRPKHEQACVERYYSVRREMYKLSFRFRIRF